MIGEPTDPGSGADPAVEPEVVEAQPFETDAEPAGEDGSREEASQPSLDPAVNSDSDPELASSPFATEITSSETTTTVSDARKGPLAAEVEVPQPPEESDDPQVRWSLLKSAAGERSARVRLEHPTLGSLRLDFALGDKEIDVRVLAPGLMSAIRLERDTDRIRALLRDHDVRLATLRIDVERAGAPEPRERPTAPDRQIPGRLSWTA